MCEFCEHKRTKLVSKPQGLRRAQAVIYKKIKFLQKQKLDYQALKKQISKSDKRVRFSHSQAIANVVGIVRFGQN